MKKSFLLPLLVLPVILFPSQIVAAELTTSNQFCNFTQTGTGSSGQTSGDVVFSAANYPEGCVIYENVNGVSSGNLTIDNTTLVLHKTLTFDPNQKIDIINGGLIWINTGGLIKQTRLCVKDADNDLYADTVAVTTDPNTGLPLTTTITQIDYATADANNICPVGYNYKESMHDLAMVDNDVTTSDSSKIATSDRELLRLGFTLAGVTDALAAAGDVQLINRNLLICTAGSCPTTNFTADSGSFYVAGKVGIGITNPSNALSVAGSIYSGAYISKIIQERPDVYSNYSELTTSPVGQGASWSVNSTYDPSANNGVTNSTFKVNAGTYNTAAGMIRFDGNSRYWGAWMSGTSGGQGTTVAFTQLANLSTNGSWLSSRGVGSDFYLTNTGNVGIGIFTPQNALNIQSATSPQLGINYSTTPWGPIGAAFGVDANGNTTITSVKSGATSTNGSILIPYSNVGIGTTNPISQFEVYNSGFGKFSVHGNLDPNIFSASTTWGTSTSNGVGLAIGINRSGGSRETNLINLTPGYPAGGFSIDNWNGTSYVNYMSINGSGNVGIGTTAPTSKLQVSGNIRIDGAGLLNNRGQEIIETDSSDYLRINAGGSYTSGTAAYGNWSFGSGKVSIGTWTPSATYTLNVVGSLYASGSSRDFKQNIKPLETDSSKIYQLSPVSYDYKSEYKDYGYNLAGGHQIGLIAEDVAKIYPELAITLDRDGVKNKVSNVDYEKLSVLLLAEMKNQKKEIDSLKQQVNDLEQRLIQIESKIK